MTDGSSSLFVSVFLRLILDVEISYAEFLELLFAECTYFYRRIWSFQYHWYAHPTGPKWTIYFGIWPIHAPPSISKEDQSS